MAKKLANFISLEGNESAAMILAAGEEAAAILDSEHNIVISEFEAIPTIVEVYLNSLLKKVSKATSETGETTLVNLFDLCQIGFSVNEDDDESEKGGNATPAFMALGLMKTMGKNDESHSGE